MRRLALLFALLVASAVPAAAKDVHSDCIEKEHKPPGECGIITEPKILNIYWDTNAAQWDADVAGITANTEARIDAHVLALTHSTYFSQLAQYHVDPPEFLGNVTASGCQSPRTVGGFPDPREVGTANLLDMALLVDCVKQHQPDKFEHVTLAVLLLPAFVKPAWITEPVGEPFIPALPARSPPFGKRRSGVSRRRWAVSFENANTARGNCLRVVVHESDERLRTEPETSYPVIGRKSRSARQQLRPARPYRYISKRRSRPSSSSASVVWIDPLNIRSRPRGFANAGAGAPAKRRE